MEMWYDSNVSLQRRQSQAASILLMPVGSGSSTPNASEHRAYTNAKLHEPGTDHVEASRVRSLER